MAPQAGVSTPATSQQEDEEVSRRMMAKRVKIIAELMQTEKDYISDLDLCIKEVIQPLRSKQVSTGRGECQGLNSRMFYLQMSTSVSMRVTCQEWLWS